MSYLRPFLLGLAAAAAPVVFLLAVLIFIANVFIGRNIGDRGWALAWTIIGLAALVFWTMAVIQWRRAYRATRALPHPNRTLIALVLSAVVALVLFLAAIAFNIHSTCEPC